MSLRRRIRKLLSFLPWWGTEEVVVRLAARGKAGSCKVSQPSAGSGGHGGGFELPDWEPVIDGPDRQAGFDEKDGGVLNWTPVIGSPDGQVVFDKRPAAVPPLPSART